MNDFNVRHKPRNNNNNNPIHCVNPALLLYQINHYYIIIFYRPTLSINDPEDLLLIFLMQDAKLHSLTQLHGGQNKQNK